ncbi:response regulator transcription factor [Isoptericola sp. b490]|uniref:helix-turn-helix transcriptional regulator n=1 Tax=Actinotalea lenta TaxID=3064654 RepID=UPI002712616D|nr:response regulator transcription factor [Isoptericola sp. b490]MDO8121270.1 response regulator transcription factor [Isoptericola sp. b490]
MTTDSLVRVALRNDYEIVVEGLARMLAPFSDRIALVELDTRTPVVRPADVVLYDTFGQPQGSLLDVTSLQLGPVAAKVVVYTWTLDAAVVTASIERGVAACLSKGLPAAELVNAIERVHAGEQLVLPAPAEARSHGLWPGRHEGLSEREAEVIALIAQGLSNEAIAARTYLSINSLKSYIRSAYRKLGVTSRTQAVLWGVDHGMVPTRSRRPGPDADSLALRQS